jgi:glycerol kinase
VAAVLAIDQGTTGTTALVVSETGNVVSRTSSEFTQHFPRPGWVEHDADELWDVTLRVAKDAIERAGELPVAIGVTNQRETVVAWDRATGEPLHRALVWQDRRTAERCRELREELGDQFIASRTGLVWDPYFSGTKIEWLLREVPDLRARAEAGEAVFGTIDSWVIYRLTDGAVHLTDHTNASRTRLYDIRSHDWSRDLLDVFRIPVHCLPDIRRSSEIVATASGDALGVEIPIAGIAGDQQAALFGQGCWEAGLAKCTYGTGAFLLMQIGDSLGTDPDRTGLLTTVSCDASGRPAYALEGAVFVAGAAIQWLRDGLGLLDDAADSEELAKSVESTGGVYFVPALVGLGAPHWEAGARGTIVGLTRGTQRAHLVRAALESMAFSTREVLEAMTATSGVELAELKVDGGAAANDWLMQYQADVLGVSVSRPDVVETTALGAAGLAGLATGVWRDAATFAETREYHTFRRVRARDEEFAGWKRAVETALYWTGSR